MSQLQHSHHGFFSWESRPGVSSASSTETEESPVPVKPLQRPPGPEDSPRRLAGRHSIHVPLPPCPFQPMQNYRHAGRRDEDPFLAAYRECTKSSKMKINDDNKKKEGKRSSESSTAKINGRGLGWLSCKQGSGVREDGVVKISHAADQKMLLLLERSQSQRTATKTLGRYQGDMKAKKPLILL